MSDRTGLLARIRDLEAALAAAERRAERAERDRDEYKQAAGAEAQLFDECHKAMNAKEASRAEAERRLALAREALERISNGWIDPHHLAHQALAALDGEGEADE